jgi:1-acyl-sn-glycerol-3-phosphate acyltransferase
MQKKFRHRVVYFLTRPLFTLYFKVRYHFRFEAFDEKSLKGPYLILGNHTQNLDPVFLAHSFQSPIYFVASTMVFNLPVISPLLKYLVNPIPIDKFRSDVKSTKRILKTLSEGAHVCVFPEGNTSYSGQTAPIDIAIAKLAKVAKVPLIFYNLQGGYLTRPRWALYPRKGLLKGGIRDVLLPEQIAAMTLEDLHQTIQYNLTVNDYDVMKKHRFIGSRKAEGAEAGFYLCPHCQAFESLVSQKDIIYCEGCDFKVEVNEFGQFERLFKGTHYQTPMDWSFHQEEALKIKVHQSTLEEPLFEDADCKLYLIHSLKPKEKKGLVQLSFSKSVLRLTGLNIDLSFSVEHLQPAIQMRNNLILHDKVSQETYYLVPPKNVNTLKYVQAIGFVQKGV